MIREIQTFLRICDNGTFAAAAEQMGITQSAVSAQIKTLEKHLGYPLFDRNRRGAVLSEQGERALPIAQQIGNLFAQMSLTDTANALASSLKMGVQTSLQSTVLSQLLPHLPDSTRAFVAPQAALLDDLRHKNLDIAILVRPDAPLPADYAVQTLHTDPCVLLSLDDISSQNHQDILSTRPLLAYDEVAFGNALLLQFFRRHTAVAPLLSSDDAHTLILLIKQGLGVGVLPQSCLNHADCANLYTLPVPVSRELVAVSLHENAAQAEMLAQIWQQTAAPNASSWQQAHNAKSETFSLSNMRVSPYYRA